jgi:putative AlgH/UPF0301 family transcriptional regulator
MIKKTKRKVIKPDTIVECSAMIKNIYHDTITLLQRHDKETTIKLVENAIEFNEKLDKLNEETEKILNDQTWRESKK